MTGWWQSLSALEHGLAIIAIFSTVILFLQTIMLLFGLGGGHDAEIDTDTGADDGGLSMHDMHGDHDGTTNDGDFSGLRLFTVRGVIAFMSVGGWLGLAVSGTGASAIVTLLSAFAGGTAALIMVAMFFRWVMGLQENGNADYSKAIGQKAVVYLAVPANNTGRGKINISVSGSFIEADAVTKHSEKIAANSMVVITGMLDETTYIVEPAV